MKLKCILSFIHGFIHLAGSIVFVVATSGAFSAYCYARYMSRVLFRNYPCPNQGINPFGGPIVSGLQYQYQARDRITFDRVSATYQLSYIYAGPWGGERLVSAVYPSLWLLVIVVNPTWLSFLLCLESPWPRARSSVATLMARATIKQRFGTFYYSRHQSSRKFSKRASPLAPLVLTYRMSV